MGRQSPMGGQKYRELPILQENLFPLLYLSLQEKTRWVFPDSEQASECAKSFWNYYQTPSYGFKSGSVQLRSSGSPSPHRYLSAPPLPLQTAHVHLPTNSSPCPPHGDSRTQVPSLRGTSGEAHELGKRGAHLHPPRPRCHPSWAPLLPSPLPPGSAVLHHRQAPDRRGPDVCSCFLLSPLMGPALLSEEECAEQGSSK